MSKLSRNLTSFLWAMIIAVVSFFIIFLFFPDTSNRFFGVSVKQPVGKTVTEVTENMVDQVGYTVNNAVSSAVTNAVSNAVSTVSETVSDVVSDVVSETLETFPNK